ncbi:vinculin family protein [Dictyocaulus viviparus]|uniref:Vinculin family protein n=1 Tax=Dictyocaulus viviparus TaxID=29172 RepID=A0A0D8Y9Z2_DICVI|nr:vinculin family protein [Dictyocaulus viviparus]
MLNDALMNVRDTGQSMSHAGRDFIRDSSSLQRRSTAINAGRTLLQAVAHFLIVADSVDVDFIIGGIDKIRTLFDNVRSATSNKEVVDRYELLTSEIEEVEEIVKRRVEDLRDSNERDDLLACNGLMKSICPLFFTTTKAYVRHPEDEKSRSNCEYAYGEALATLNAMVSTLKGENAAMSFSAQSRLRQLVTELDQFQNRVYLEPGTYNANIHRPELEELLERIVSGSAAIADSGSTRPDRKQKIVNECNNLRQALQDLLGEYEKNCGRDNSDDVDIAMVLVGRKAKDLRRHLRRAIVDHVSDAFLDTSTPLLILIDAAKRGDSDATSQTGQLFLDHANKLISVAHLACEMSSDVEGVRIIRFTAGQLMKLAPQLCFQLWSALFIVVNAAHLLCAHSDSKAAQENMDVFRGIWQDKTGGAGILVLRLVFDIILLIVIELIGLRIQMTQSENCDTHLLTMAIDSIMTLDDFLAVSEAHIVEDAMTGLQAIHEGDGDMLDRASGAIRGRSLRVCSAVDAEMDVLQLSAYTERVKMATRKLRDEMLGLYALRAEAVVTHLEACGSNSTQEERDRDSDEFINACTLVHDAVKEIRNALLINRHPEDVDSDNEYEDDVQAAIYDNTTRISEGENQQKIMRRLPEEDKKKIQEQIDVFKITQTKFEREVAKWDESGNDIIVLAKHMCMIMTDMTDFTRGHGPLKTTMDVIRAAQEISVDGSKLNALAKQIGDESVDSNTKADLFAYLSRITLYCQQLNICSKVKADVQQIGNDVVVSGLESAMSLIQTARNLLGAVVLTVKAAYIASTKFRRHNSKAPYVQWRMAPPMKQPLIPVQKKDGVIRRASERRPMAPARALAEFVQ